MRIAILADPRSPEAAQVERAVAALAPDAPIRLSLALGEDERAAIAGDAVVWNGERLDRLDALYVTGLRYENPVLPPADSGADWSCWQSRHVIRQQGYSFLWSLLSRVEAAGVRLYNPPSSMLATVSAHRALDRLRAQGIPVADVTLTNEDAEAQALQQRCADVVWRPSAGRGTWQLFRDRQRRHIVGRDKPPVLLAPAADGPIRRVFVVDGRVVLAVDTLAPAPAAADRGVERLEVLRPVDPASIPGVDLLAAAPGRLGLRWAVVTAVTGAAGPIVYDIDPDPVLTDLPDPLRRFLAGALAGAMLGGADAGPAPTEEAERPSLLLRRMLAIQFDMEATKYAAE